MGYTYCSASPRALIQKYSVSFIFGVLNQRNCKVGCGTERLYQQFVLMHVFQTYSGCSSRLQIADHSARARVCVGDRDRTGFTHARTHAPAALAEAEGRRGAAATLKLLSVAPQRQDDSGALSFPKERGRCKCCSCNLAADEEQRQHRTTVPGHGPILTTVSHLSSAM